MVYFVSYSVRRFGEGTYNHSFAMSKVNVTKAIDTFDDIDKIVTELEKEYVKGTKVIILNYILLEGELNASIKEN